MISQLEFHRQRISEKPAGFYMNMLLILVADADSKSIRSVADIVLARAQNHLCQQVAEAIDVEEYERDTAIFLSAFNTLAQCRFHVERGRD